MNENRFVLLHPIAGSNWHSPLYVNVSSIVAFWNENGSAKLLLNCMEGHNTITTVESYEEVLSSLLINS